MLVKSIGEAMAFFPQLRMNLLQQRNIGLRKAEKGFALRDFIPIQPDLSGNHFDCLM